MKNIFYFLVILLLITMQGNAQCWQKISTGYNFALGIKTNGTLWAWGSNTAGALGNGTTIASNSPMQTGTAANWQNITAGAEHVIAIKTNGTLWAWGRNSEAQLGDGTNNNSYVPIQIGTDNDWAIVSTGSEHTLAIKTDGTLWAWGGNQFGQCGNGTPPNSVGTPLQVGSDNDWQTIATGSYHSLAIKNDGTLWVWGQNNAGQLGDGSNTDLYVPTQIGTASDWSKIGAGSSHSLAIKTNGTLWAWGSNGTGQLGDGNNADLDIPTQIGTATTWSTISGGQNHSLGIQADGTLWAWGLNDNGQLGDGTYNISYIPLQVGTSTNWSLGDAGGFFSAALKTDATLWTFGDNADGQLGDATNTQQNVPIQLGCPVILPVTWLYFNGRWQNKNVLLQWATASESNTDRFDIEHSTDGIHFNKAGNIKAEGISNSVKQYSFIHTTAAAGKNFYRLKQIDKDTRFTYSSVIVLQNSNNRTSLIIAPNPVQNEAILYFNEPGSKTIQLFGMNGVLLFTEKLNGENNRHTINMSNMAKGIYLLRLTTAKGVETYKITKQ